MSVAIRVFIVASIVLIPFSRGVFAQQRIEKTAEKPDGLLGSVAPDLKALRSANDADITAGARRVGPTIDRAVRAHFFGGTAATSGLLSPSAEVRIMRAENGTAEWITGDLGRTNLAAGKRHSAQAMKDAALDVVTRYGHALHLEEPARELELLSATTDALGMSHVRMQQVYKGLPVWGSDLYVHMDPTGQAYAINGRYEPTPRLLDVGAGISDDAALNTVIRVLTSENRWAPPSRDMARRLGLEAPQSNLVIYPDRDRSTRLAYEVTVHANFVEHYTFFVDAKTSEVIHRVSNHCTIMHSDAPMTGVRVTMPELNGAKSPGDFFDATAYDLNGVERTIRVYEDDEGYLPFWDLPNISPFSYPDEPELGGAATITANNASYTSDDFEDHLGNITSADNTWSDPSVVSAHHNMYVAYTYYSEKHSRRAIDDKDDMMLSVVHVQKDGAPMDNAYWNGAYMAYGDGNVAFKPLAGAIDVAGHEMTHGVIGNSAGLVYEYQPGALNESFADVFGVLIDPEDYLLGEDITKPGYGIALRDLQNPASSEVLSSQPAHMDDFNDLALSVDHGGVHVNSGIPNRAAFLVMDALGHDKTGKIYYRALTSYLTRRSQFGDARMALTQSAVDLYGQGSVEAAAVSDAFEAVGITLGTQGASPALGNEVEPVEGDLYVAFLTADRRVGLMNDENDVIYLDSTVIQPSLTTQLSIARDDHRLFFVNEHFQVSYIDLSTEGFEAFVMDDVHLAEAGDIWNASVSPDGAYVAMASVYDEDPTLYFYDGDEVSALELKISTSQQGIFDGSIVYPDVISWSPNAADLTLGFDALRRLVVGNDTTTYWGIFELDLETGSIVDLVPTMTGISIGNISYSSLDPDLYAYNIVQEGATPFINVFKSETGLGEAVGLGFSEEVHAMRPAFSPDDEGIVFSNDLNGDLWTYSFADYEAEFFMLESAALNPLAFNLAPANVATEDRSTLPSAIRLHANYPNPFNPSTTVSFDIPSAMDVRVAVYDVLGREVAVLSDGRLPGGSHRLEWTAGNVPSGVYFVALESGAMSQITKAILLK